MEFLTACASGSIAEAADHLRAIGGFDVGQLFSPNLAIDHPETKQADECRSKAITQSWPMPVCPAYDRGNARGSRSADPACIAALRVDPAIILATIQLMNTRTFEGLAVATTLMYHAVGLTGSLKVKAQAGLCEVACTDTHSLHLHPWILTPLFDAEPCHFPLPKTPLLTVSHFWLAWAHEWGHILRDSTEEGADSNAVDMLIAASCLLGDIDALRTVLHTKFRIGDYPLDRVDEFGNTALCIAAEEGHTLIVAFLLQNGASPTFPNRAGQLPGDFAKLYGYTAIQRLLLSS